MQAKIYAIVTARFLLWLFFAVLYVPFFAGYIVLQICEWFVSFYEGYRVETTAMLKQYNELLKKKV